MSKFNVTFVPSLKKTPEVVEAEDVVAVSDYTVQFVDYAGHTTLVLGGVERVQLIEAPKATGEFATVDTTGKPAIVPRATIEDPHPCQASEATSAST